MNALTTAFLLGELLLLVNGGFVNRFQDNKIVGGWEAEPHSHPYIVSLQNKYLWMHRHTCAGSILNEYWILTAAHCVRDNDSFWNYIIPMDIVAGIHSVKGKESSAQTIRVVERIIHPDYEGGVNPNDIALLRLAKPIFFNSRVQPIRLAEQDTTPIGESRLAGWGLLKSAPNSKAPEKLQEIDLPILTFKECNDSVESFRDSEEDRNPLDERSNVCTGPLTGGKSACNGDSGGPLVQIENNKTVQIGIVSWGYNPCGTKGAPSVYTKVSSFVDFITEHLDLDDDYFNVDY
ncbi:trypsin-1-like [Arctopsyche grandis]|uniref:trypsin-1-like n=1 Tax=Arctopsyche grandis TaxID=121162 RepID=UPI00406D6676